MSWIEIDMGQVEEFIDTTIIIPSRYYATEQPVVYTNDEIEAALSSGQVDVDMAMRMHECGIDWQINVNK